MYLGDYYKAVCRFKGVVETSVGKLNNVCVGVEFQRGVFLLLLSLDQGIE